MVVNMVLNTVGGLGLFLFGMNYMSDGIKKAAGQKLRQVLESMTRRPIMGFTVGLVVTGLIQSSSATTVMIIGLVNAGLLTLRQAICVIFGTNVGTTVTGWLVSLTGLKFNITSYAILTIGIGFLLNVVCKSRKMQSLGQIMLGFGMLFVGLDFMKEAFVGLEKSEAVVNWLASMGGKPFLSILAGTAITMLIQSSSASIAIVQMLAINYAFGSDWENVLNIAIPFVLGSNIGTTITAQIASARSNTNARRTAWAHSLFNIIGTGLALPFVYTGLYAKFVHLLMQSELGPSNIQPAIAVAHTAFNVTTSMIFLPFASVFEKAVIKLVPSRPGEVFDKPVVLEQHLLNTPVIALSQTKREIVRMTQKAKQSVICATEGIVDGDMKKLDRARRLEDLIDEFQHEITTYLVKLSQRQLSDDVSVELPVLLHTVNDLERIGDHAVNIAEIAERKKENKLTFTDTATNESGEMVGELLKMFNDIIPALEHNNPRNAKAALLNESRLNKMQVSFRRNHVQRMTEGLCSAEAGLIFIDLIDNVEKIGDHLTNIAQSVIGGLQWAGVETNTLSGEYKALRDED